MAVSDTSNALRADRRYVKAAMKIALLDQDHELALAKRWREKGDQTALHELTQAYMRLVVAHASRYRHYGLPVGDLIQEGNIGLMQAAARFEPAREVRFSTYAAWWIRSTIQDYILRNWSIVRTGTTAAQKSLFFNLRRLQARLEDGRNGTMTQAGRSYVADQLHVSTKDVEAMEGRLSGGDRSLNAPMVDDGDGDWQDFLADDRPLPEDIVMNDHDSMVRRQWVGRALKSLSEREAAIIRARMMDDQTATLESLGGKLGISKERVRQIEHQALRKLKTALLKEVSNPVERGLI
jgi:RNA polymerase sigma-32 factor